MLRRPLLDTIRRIHNTSACNLRHITTNASTPIPRRSHNLLSRYAPALPTTPTPPPEDIVLETEEAKAAGLSPQGLGNLKSVEAAAKISHHSTSLVKIGGIEVSLPRKPEPPGPEDCCMSGCAVCVHDLYIDALKDYKTSLTTIRDRLVASSVPQSLWPHDIVELNEKKGSADELDDLDLDPSTKAFMLLERNLKHKHEADAPP